MMSMDTSAREDDDRELVLGMLASDGRAWRLFLARHDRLIYAAIHRVLRRFPDFNNVTDREEIHATLLSSLVARDMHKLRTFDFARSNRLSTWISMLATHATWDYLRTVSRTPRATSPVDAESIEADTSCPLQTVIAREQCARLGDALETMTEREREFIELYHLQAQAPSDVAAAMSISVHTVYTKRFKLKIRLEKVLGG